MAKKTRTSPANAEPTVRLTGNRLSRKPKMRAALEALASKRETTTILTASERDAILAAIIRDPKTSIGQRQRHGQ